MSNTAPAYLEGFQRIVMSVDEINGQDDVKHFVSDHRDLTADPKLPEFERHPYRTGEAVSVCVCVCVFMHIDNIAVLTLIV